LSQGAIPVSDISELRAVLEGQLGSPTRDFVSDMLVRGHDPVLAAIRTNPSRPDDLARDLGLDIIEVARRIGTLEGEGVVTKYRDGRYGA
jgi:DNA-binding MarR family transcriptional regulator